MAFGHALALVVALRLMAIVLLRPGGALLDSLGDFGFYRELAELTLNGRLPFRDFWVEYPPLFPFVLTGLLKLAVQVPGWPSTTAPFYVLLALFLLACDLANVVFVRRIARHLWDRPTADSAALLYALQPYPLLAGLGWFDAFPLTFLLLALDATLARRAGLAGSALALGALAKVIPLAIAPAVVHGLATSRRALVATATGGAIALVIVGPLFLTGSPFVEASLRATLNRSSWESVWAILEGYWGVGTVAPVPTRLQLEAAGRPLHASTLPWGAITAVHGLAMLGMAFAPAQPTRPRRVVALAALSLLVTLFFSRGYSPQFLVYQLPLLVALWPNRRGVAYTLVLTGLGFLEWPIVLSLFPDRPELIATAIGLRTYAWFWLMVELAGEIWPRLGAAWQRARPRAGWLSVSVGAAALVWLGASLVALLPARGEHVPVVTYVKELSPDGLVVASSRAAFYRVAPLIGTTRAHLGVGAGAAEAPGRAGAGDVSDAWLLLDHSEGEPEARAELERAVAALGSRTTDRWFGFYHLVGVLRPDAWRARLQPIAATFGGELALVGWLPTRDRVAPGQPLRVVLGWRVLAEPRADYKAFAHLLDDPTEAIVAQEDRPLDYLGRLASSWRVGEEPVTALDLLTPLDGRPGPSRLRIGLYDPTTGARLGVGASDRLDLPGPTRDPVDTR